MMKFIRKNVQVIAYLFAAAILLTSCGSTTMIESYPSGADVYINGESVGQTPYPMTDTKIVGTCSSVRLEKDGYETFTTSICRNEEPDVGAIIGGVLVIIPFLWAMKYKPIHQYKLRPMEEKAE